MVELDVRTLPSPKKHARIHELLQSMAPGETLRLVNDHDPVPLRYELANDYPESFEWTYVESGPQTWRIDIVKTRAFAATQGFELLADSPALTVHRLSVAPRESIRLGFEGAATIIFEDGSGTITVHGHSRPIAAGRVELLVEGDECTIAAAADAAVHAYIVTVKEP